MDVLCCEWTNMTIKNFSNVVDATIINIGYFVRKIKYTVSEHFGDTISINPFL